MQGRKLNKYSRWIVWFGIMVAILGVFILVSILGDEYGYYRYLPYGLLLLCPLTHFVMMKMHDNEQISNQRNEEKDDACH